MEGKENVKKIKACSALSERERVRERHEVTYRYVFFVELCERFVRINVVDVFDER